LLCCKNPTFNTIYKLAIVPYIFVLEKALGIPNLLKLLHFYSADALVNTGLAKLGYEYVNIDDCWAESDRDYQVRRSNFPTDATR